MNQQNQQTNEKKHNYFYKITNLINGKYYYGIRSTNKDLEKDNYLGSGTRLISAIKKYGKENFKKEIIANYATRKEVSEHEERVVTKNLIEITECYNIRSGGENSYIMNSETRQKISKSQSGENNHYKGKKHTEEIRKKISLKNKGKIISESQRQKVSEKLKARYKDTIRTDVAKVRCSINGIQYNSLAEASEAINVIPETISYRMKSKNFPTWIFIEKYKG